MPVKRRHVKQVIDTFTSTCTWAALRSLQRGQQLRQTTMIHSCLGTTTWTLQHQGMYTIPFLIVSTLCALNHHQVLGAWRGVCAVALFALGFRTRICHPHLWMEKVQLLQPLLLSRKNVQKDPIHFRLINFRVKNLHYEMLIHPANYSMVWYQFLINWFILS